MTIKLFIAAGLALTGSAVSADAGGVPSSWTDNWGVLAEMAGHAYVWPEKTPTAMVRFEWIKPGVTLRMIQLTGKKDVNVCTIDRSTGAAPVPGSCAFALKRINPIHLERPVEGAVRVIIENKDILLGTQKVHWMTFRPGKDGGFEYKYPGGPGFKMTEVPAGLTEPPSKYMKWLPEAQQRLADYQRMNGMAANIAPPSGALDRGSTPPAPPVSDQPAI